MTTAAAPGILTSQQIDAALVRTARVTGLLYLGFFVAGVLGSLVVRGQLFSPDDAHATLSHVLNDPWLARVGIGLELSIVLSQALTAIWFYRLFRSVNPLAAGSLTAFGLVNSVVILASAAVLATALDTATDASLSGSAATVQLLYVLSGNLWGVAALFFGLWLLPMGWLVLRSGWLPRALGWALIVGGVCYTLSPYVTYLFPGAEAFGQLLTVPSILGEVWIAGYLIIIGVRHRLADESGLVTPTAPARHS